MTHVNAYKMDVEDAYNKAMNALSEFKTKVGDLVTKYEENVDSAPQENPAPATPAEGPGPDGVDHSGDPVEPSKGADDAPVGPGTTAELKQKESGKSDDNYTDKSHSSSSSVTKSK